MRLGQLSPAGLDCAEITRLYNREKKNAATRSGDHKKRAKANMERLEPAFKECQNLPEYEIPVAAGGQPITVSALTQDDVQRIVYDAPESQVDYGRIAGFVIGGAVLVGGLIYLVFGRKGK